MSCHHKLTPLLTAFLACVAVGCGSSVSTDDLTSSNGFTPRVDFRTLGTIADTDDDGLPDMYDPAPENPDANANGVIDGIDAEYIADVLQSLGVPSDPYQDTDEDGIYDSNDSSPLNPDANNNGIPDGFETDTDGDGLFDAVDHYPDLADANCNGILDGEDADYDNTVDYPDKIRGGEIICGGTH